jgi:beta-glucosidase
MLLVPLSACILVLSGMLAHPSPALAYGPAVINDNNGASNCLDVFHGEAFDHNNVDIFPCNNSIAQSWNFRFLGQTRLGPAFEIRAFATLAARWCLNVLNNGTANYTNVDIATCDGSSGQVWVKRGITLESAVTGGTGDLCLDVFHSGTAPYTNVDIFHCNGSAAQSWIF